jgi:hypothetical protein
MTRERDERMWNLAYRLAQSGKHRNYRMGVAGVWVSPSATIFIRRASPRKAGRHLSGSTKWFRKCLQRVHRRALILVTSIGGSLFWTNGWITAGTAGRWNNGRLAPSGGGTAISGSTPSGGQITPSLRSSFSLRV